jgi:hypothetical protein
MIRKWFRDVIVRSAELIQEREKKTPAPVNIAKAAKCSFCDKRWRLFEISTSTKTDYACEDHIGSYIVDWTVADELTVVRL